MACGDEMMVKFWIIWFDLAEDEDDDDYYNNVQSHVIVNSWIVEHAEVFQIEKNSIGKEESTKSMYIKRGPFLLSVVMKDATVYC